MSASDKKGTTARTGHNSTKNARSLKKHLPPPTGCEWCGADLVRRDGPHGVFFGCFKFPDCRFTRQVRAGESTGEPSGAPHMFHTPPEGRLKKSRRDRPYGSSIYGAKKNKSDDDDI
jgi:ssDNA-binding Zn-finger/Zn-ribbon topoisomerase 1